MTGLPISPAPTSESGRGLHPNLAPRVCTALRAALCVLGLAWLAGCVHSDAEIRKATKAIEAGRWSELRAERFTLYSDGDTAALEAFAEDLARFIAVVDEIAVAPPPRTPARFFLLSGKSQESFLDGWQTGVIFTTLSGFHSFVRADEHSPVNRHTLLHEFTHYLTLRNNSLAYPKWYIEGFAEFLGSTRTRGDTMELGSAPPGQIEALEWRKSRKKEFELEPTLSYDPASGAGFPPALYASSWAFVHYLHTSLERKAQLSRMLRLQLAGAPWYEAFAQTFSESPEQLAEKIAKHTARIARGAPASFLHLDLEQLKVDSEWTIRTLSMSEVNLIFGEIALVHGQYSFAEATFRNLLEREPNNPRAQSALVAAMAGQDRFEAVHELVVRINVAALSESEALNHLAFAHYREAESMASASARTPDPARNARYAQAADLFDRATRSDSRSAVAWAGLGRSRAALGEFAGALEAFQKASETGERDAELMLDWGLAEQKAGRREAAQAKWTTVLRHGNQKQRDRAAELIAELPTAEDAAETGP